MCGRFALDDDGTAVQAQFDLAEKPHLAPRYNIAPTQPIAAVGQRADGTRGLTHFHWGLIPSWAKDPSIGSRMINARAETVAEKPSFRAAYQRRRCLVPMSGFFEWQKQADGRKQPQYIYPADGEVLFGVAGLWERWQSEDGSEILSCTLLTTTPNELIAPLHDRMPLILSPADYGVWLDGSAAPTAVSNLLLRSYDPTQMAYHPVSLTVNNPRHDDPLCIQPLA